MKGDYGMDIIINMKWDPEADVWIAVNDEIGLILESGSYDALVERAVNLLEVNSKTTRSICLRIGVNHKYALFQCGKRRSQIDGCCCLANASFLICERDYFTEFFVHDLTDMYILDCKDTIFFPNTRILSQIKYIFLHFND